MATALLDGDPQRLGGYWLAGRLGAGGQGVVYEAYTEDGHRVAIKVLHGDQAAQLGREATAAQRVASFCTASVIDAHLDGPRPYIVSEYVEGPSLRKAAADGRRFTGGDLHRLATAIATALTAIHDAGVIHRDLKPDNVLLGPDGPRVIDFGIARTLEMPLTATGLVTGTPTYMAPEVFTGQRAGAPADVFAWGGIVMFAAIGADPFEAESLGGVMHRVLSASPDLEVLPGPLRPLVAAALSKDPLERPTARALLLALVSGGGGLDTARLLAEGDRAAVQVGVPSDDPGLGALAEQAYASLGPDERELAAEVFLRLVTVDERGELVTRRAALAELVEGRALPVVAAITRTLEVFGYLVSRSGDELWLARPALTHAWPRFRRWIDANRDGLAVHREILGAARRWEAAGRRDGDLFQGSGLENALQWAATARRNITLASAERDFLEASAGRTRRRARRNRLVSLSLAGLLVISLVAGGLAVHQSVLADERAERIAAQRDQAEAARIATVAGTLRRTDPRLAMLLSAAAWRLDRTPQTRAALTASLAQRESAMFKDPAGSSETVRVLSADGRTLASVGEDAARLWDVRTGRRTGGITKLGMAGEQVASVALSPTGRTLVVQTDARVRAWDLRSGKTIRTWTFDRRLNLRDSGGGASIGPADRFALITMNTRDHAWDLATGTRTMLPAQAGVMAPRGSSVFVMTEKPAVERWSLPGLRLQKSLGAYGLARCVNCGPPEAVSPDGRWLAQSLEKVLRLTDLTDGSIEEIGDLDGAGTQGSWNHGAATFSQDGRLIATVTGTGVQFWRAADTQLLTSVTVQGNGDEPPAAAFDPDGRTFRYLAGDRVFSVDIADLAAVPPESGLNTVTLSPDGRLMAASDMTSGATLRDSRGGKAIGAIPGEGELASAAFDATGRLAAVSHHSSGEITVMDVGSRAVLREVAPGAGDLEPAVLAFSPDGTRLAAILSSPDDGRAVIKHRIGLWEWKTGRRLWTADLGELTDLAFSPDGRRLAVAGAKPRLVDAATGRPAGEPFGGGGTKVFFTRSGRAVVVLDERGRLTLWDAAAPGRGVPVTQGRFGGVPVAAYSPREDVVAVGTRDGRVQLFDPVAGTLLGTLMDTGGGQDPDLGESRSVVFTAGGAAVAAVGGNGVVREWPVEPERVTKAVCARAGSTLSPQEWGVHVPNVPYTEVCPR
ncbi:serine/threonine-protein kinase [Nonomuraea sp. NPDC046570]|uniref:WD40 repeat domain-containing serine/threonine protein kinase n=1 Tax=Nonomuraea sp. NPDC046570 TaxID=3155255 RepID=UPI0033E78F8B